MSNGVVQEQNLERQIGCMAGFLQIFDRSQIVAGKRLYSVKRLSHSSSPEIVQESEKKIGNLTESEPRSPPPADNLAPSTAEIAPRSPLPLPVFEFKEGTRSSWKFSREAPRLSLDSRAIVDAKGSLYPRETRTNDDENRRSPSVIARLMGLEAVQSSDPELTKKSELRRSASESRVNKDHYHHRFSDANASPARLSHAKISSNVIREHHAVTDQDRASSLRPSSDPKMYGKSEPAKSHNRGIGQRKSYYDSADFFPEPKQNATVYGEIERRLKMRGIDEPSKDLETLKQILEALQLKGLLHPRKKASSQTVIDHRNYVYDGNRFSHDDFPIVVMKPTRSQAPISRSPRFGNESPPPSSSFRSPKPNPRRNTNIPVETTSQSVSPRRNKSPNRTVQSQTVRNENSVKSPNRRRPLSIDTQRKPNDGVSDHRRVSPVNSPKVNHRRSSSIPDQRSPRNRKSTVEITQNRVAKMVSQAEDESSTVSESTSTDTERAKMEECKEGRNLLERCDKLLHSIAEITATELQPSPVSVLDPYFYKDESSTSPIMKRSIEFNDQPIELEDEVWESALSSPIGSSEDCDLIYVSEVLRALNYMPENSDIFHLLEKRRYLNGDDTSKVSRLHRRLIFDTIAEILSRNREILPWNVVSVLDSSIGKSSLRHVWSEFKRIKERDESEDLFEIICAILRKDLAADSICGWKDCPVEISEAVLDIERLIFKDLIGETIGDLATFSIAKCYVTPSPFCRKLVF